MKYLIYLATITILLFGSSVSVHAESSTTPTNKTIATPTVIKVAPLKTLDTVGRLAQSLGITAEEVQAEIDSGKTFEKVAADHGMPASYYKSRVLQANFKPLSTVKKTTIVKKTTKITKVVKPVVKKVVKPVVPVKKSPVNKKTK